MRSVEVSGDCTRPDAPCAAGAPVRTARRLARALAALDRGICLVGANCCLGRTQIRRGAAAGRRGR